MKRFGSGALSRRELLAGGVAWALFGCQPGEPSPPRPGAVAGPVANHAPEPMPEPGQSGEIRVSLTDDPAESVRLEAVSEIKVVDAARQHVVETWPAKTKLELRRSGQGWVWGDQTLKGRTLELRPARSPGVWVDDRLCRGILRLVPGRGIAFRVVNHLPLEHYLASVIDGEMPGNFPIEARKAQAVAARSFAVMQRQRVQGASDFDLYASAGRSQRYLGSQYRDGSRAMAGESDSARRAVRETRGMLCTREGELFRTYYSACCGGRTTKGSLYFSDASELPSVACNACEECPKHHWLLRLSVEEFSAAVRKAAPGVSKTFVAAAASASGSRGREGLCQVTVRDSKGRSVSMSGVALRSTIGANRLYSGWFTVRRENEGFQFEGRGFGHGVGMCQWGAAGHAERGADFRAILKRYYPGCDIQPVAGPLLSSNDRVFHDH